MIKQFRLKLFRVKMRQ